MSENSRQPTLPRSRLSRANAAMTLLFIAAFLSGCVPWVNSPVQEITPISSATSIALPDLIIKSVKTETSSEFSCSDPSANLQLLITIENQGNASAGPFEISVNNTNQQVTAGLAQGEMIELTMQGILADLLIQIDPSNQVQESDETNNQFQETVLAPTLPAECFSTPTPEVATQESVFTMQGHTGKVLSVAFSPDGNLVASGSVDNTVRLWRAKEGTLLRTMSGHPFPVSVVIFSPNGANLATGSPDGIIRIWSVSNGLLGKTLQAHGGGITDLQYTPDNRQLISSAQDFTVRLWSMPDGRLLKTIDEGLSVITSLTSSVDGKEVIWAESDGTLRVLRLADSAWLKRWQGIQESATSLALSPDGKLLVSGYADGRLQVWMLPEGDLLDTLNGHDGQVTSLAFSQDGKWMASSSEDANVRLWRVAAGQVNENISAPGAPLILSKILIGHSGHVNQVAFSPKGDLVATGGDDGSVRIWDILDE